MNENKTLTDLLHYNLCKMQFLSSFSIFPILCLVVCIMTVIEGRTDQEIVVKDTSNELSERDDGFSFQTDEDILIEPRTKLDAKIENDVSSGTPHIQPQHLFDVGFEVGFKSQKVQIPSSDQQNLLLLPPRNAAVVGYPYWGQENGGGSGRELDEKRMKTIADEVSESILQAADALYFSINPGESHASGLIWGGGGGGSVDFYNDVKNSRCSRSNFDVRVGLCSFFFMLVIF